jgi:hypothetical protein
MRPSLALMDILMVGAMDDITAEDVIRQECQLPCNHESVDLFEIHRPLGIDSTSFGASSGIRTGIKYAKK